MQILTYLVLVFIFYLFNSIARTEEFVACSSINLQGRINPLKLEKIKNCTIVIGHIRILNAKFELNTTYRPIFPNLVEITDHLLVFQAQNINSLDYIFPKLSVIRGHKLFKNYALIIFLTNSLLKISLNSLISINKGSILLSRLYHTCYINTIDWNYLIKDKSSIKPTITLFNNECFSQSCKPICTNTTTLTSNCWNENNCQLKCSNECVNNCNLNKPNECCSNKLCMYCRDDECVSCSKYRNLNTGLCVEECPFNTLVYESHSCIKLEDCSRDSNSLIQSYHVLNNTNCVRECPNGYRSFIQILNHSKSRSFNVSRCVRCEDGICKRDCKSQSFTLNSFKDLDAIRNCFRVKQLHIELRSNITNQALIENLQYLEEINDYLVIVRNKHLKSLSFFKSLRLIKGVNLFEKKFALFIHTNEILRELWDYKQTKFRVKNGTIKFFENPELCYEEIENFMHETDTSNMDADVSFNFNGYRRLTCSNRTIDLNFKLAPKQIVVSWNITVSDLRRLKGFILSYIEVPDDFVFDQNDVDFMHSTHKSLNVIPNSFYDWNYMYIQYDEYKYKMKKIIKAGIDVEPFTRYAIYVKADLTMDAHSINNSTYSLSFGSDKLISQINYVYSLAAQPSRVDKIVYEPISYSEVNLKWEAPRRPNGIIDFYFIAYTSLKDLEILPNNTDNCQFVLSNRYIDQYLIGSNYNKNIKNSNLAADGNEIKSSNSNENKQVCMESNSNKFKKLKLNDEEKNDIISVEDEIYNLAFKAAKFRTNPKSFQTYPPILSKLGKIDESKINLKQFQSQNETGQTESSEYQINVTRNSELNQSEINNLINSHYNLSKNLMSIIKRELFSQEEDEAFNMIKVSNKTFNATISNLASFGRYIVSVGFLKGYFLMKFLKIIACQNITNALIDYTRTFKEASSLIDYLKKFPIENLCSKVNLITFRSLPDEKLDQIVEAFIVEEQGVDYFKWSKPIKPNGFVYKYNLRFTDIKLNKTHGPLCHALSDNLKVPLNQFLLTEGHEYIIQVQAVSTAGPGLWSIPLVKYRVPIISQYYLKLISQIVGVLVLFFVIFTTGLLFYKKYSRSKEKGYFSINSHYYYFRPDEWEIKRENVIIGERIGSGCFAEVHKGKIKLKNEQLVDCAIKFCGSDDQNRQRILKEANMMKSINTTHIVKLLGVVSRDNPAYLILEFMDKGDLKEYLKSFKSLNREGQTKQEISVERFYRIGAEIADGMLWLSEHKYVHRDLAARNCLISKDDVIKIADLGLSKDIYQNPVYREKCKSLLPIRWMSPESLIDGSSTTKSDVWSYGVVIWEMSTYGDNPYTGKENEDVIQFVKDGGKLELPPNAPLKFFTLVNKCLLMEDYKRISFKEILDILDPDLTNDFKQTSYYHNEYKNKLFKKKAEKQKQQFESNEKTLNLFDPILNKIADPSGDSDNYM